TQLVIYSRQQTIAVYVQSGDICTGNGVQDQNQGVPPNNLVTQFTLSSGGSVDTVNGRARFPGACTAANDPARQYPNTGAVYGATGVVDTTKELRLTSTQKLGGYDDLWAFRFEADVLNPTGCNGDCLFNGFRLDVRGIGPGNVLDNGSGIWVSQDQTTPGLDGDQFGISPPDYQDYFNYKIDFATSCDMTAGTSTWVLLYDDDNHQAITGNGSPQDLTGLNNGFNSFDVRLQAVPRQGDFANAGNVPFSSVEYINNSGNNIPGPANPNTDAGSKVSHYNLDPSGDWSTFGTWTSKNRIKLNFTALPLYKYRLQIRNVTKFNNMQFRIPFETIFADLPCQVPVKPFTDIGPNPVEAGTTATANYRVEQYGGDKLWWGQFAYSREIWLDRGTPGVYDGPGVDSALPADGPSSPLTFQNPVPPGTTNLDLGQRSIGVQSGFESVCSRLILSPLVPKTVQIIDNPAVSCTPIAKKPQFEANGGDVRSGGVYPVNNATACQIPSYYQNYAKIVGADYGAYPQAFGTKTQFGIFSVGRIYKFGSNGLTDREAPVRGPGVFGSANWGDGTRSQVPYGGLDGYFNSGASWEPVTRCLPDGYSAYKVTGQTRVSVNGSVDDGNLYIEDGSQVMQINGPGHGVRLCQRGTCTPTAAGAPARPTYTVPAGKRIVIHVQNPGGNVGGSVVIQDNIQYPTSVNGVSQIPQFVLLVDDGIKVAFAEGVTRFDGMIVARSSVSTCARIDTLAGYSSVPTPLSNADCNKQLVVNGAIVTSRVIKPYRTFGNDNINAAPSNAEVFTLTPELMISDYYNSQAKPVITTIKQTELPPRF
ncbi:MAG: hypothetical protein ABIR46_01740, partial [Candidatus Saccharimonadales bacterium]